MGKSILALGHLGYSHVAQKEIKGRALCPCIQTCGDLRLHALLGEVRATATITVIVSEPMVAAIITPAVSATRNGLGADLVAVALTRYGLFWSAVISIV